ncbi:MAG: iron-containing alcohol dehydrogenase [Nitrospirota bacterium]
MTRHRPNHDRPDTEAVSWMAMVVLGSLVLAAVLVTAGVIALPAMAPSNAGGEAEELVSPGFVGNQWVMTTKTALLDALVQEDIGTRILAVERYYSDRLSQLAQRWSQVSNDTRSFAEGRNARLQEALGVSIAATAQRLYIERWALDTALADARATVRAILSGGWLQERVGAAIVQTAAEVPPADPRFLPRVEARVTGLSTMESGVANRAAAEIGALNARLARFPHEGIIRLADAVADGHRVARFYDASVEAQTARIMGGIINEIAQARSVGDYLHLAEAANAAARPSWKGGGFLEFGAAALLGAIAMMAWVAFSTRMDFRRAFPRVVKTPSARQSAPAPRWKGRGVRPYATTLSIWPREVSFGLHCTRDIGVLAARGHVRHATIVTDQGVAQKGLVDPVTASLAEAGVTCDVMDQASREVPHTQIAKIADWCKEAGTDVLIAVGGGSVIDTAKAVGIILTNGGSILDSEGIERVGRPITPFYAVPTTAGSGAETSPFCYVRDETRSRKIAIFSRHLIPERIVIDPLMTRSMPPELTASTGMDALANAIEAYFSTWANPLSDTLALDAMRLISENLRAVVAHGNNLSGRQQMALAAFEAGQASVNTRSGPVHALGHSLSELLDIPERVGNAILLPHIMKAYLYADVRRMAKVAEALGESMAGLSERAAAQRAIDAVMLLMMDVGLPITLEKIGVDRNAVSALSEQALQDPILRSNPGALTREDIEAIYEDAFIEYAEMEMNSATVQGRPRARIH